MKERYYRPELDALRFFAFATVFLHHASWHSPRPALNHESRISEGLPYAAHPSGLAVIQNYGATAPFQTLQQSFRLGAIHDACGFGLCIFFLLSAYLIVTILLREKDTTGSVSLSSFAARRILRIWPLYNLYILKHGWILETINPLWSLSVEEQFSWAQTLDRARRRLGQQLRAISVLRCWRIDRLIAIAPQSRHLNVVAAVALFGRVRHVVYRISPL